MKNRKSQLVGINRARRKHIQMTRKTLLIACRILKLAVFGVSLVSLSSCDRAVETARVAPSTPKKLDAATIQTIEQFCGDCHALPRPESFPRGQWHQEVRKGFEFYARSGRQDLRVPPFSDVLTYYRNRAPENMTWPEENDSAGVPVVRFEKETLDLLSDNQATPEFSFLDWVQLAKDQPRVFVGSDFRSGHLVELSRSGDGLTHRQLGRVRNPGPIAICDLDGDDLNELIVADLGSALPADHDRGQVVMFRRNVDEKSYEKTLLFSDCGRVSDVRASDFDRDGRLDLVVAEFGWHTTGGIHLLMNRSTSDANIELEPVQLDQRSGTIHVPVHDFDGNGFPDIVALISQHLESVELFQNEGTERFRRRSIWQGVDLTFGSSGLDLVDLDEDGLMDILTTNGDSFDNSFVSPWHGAQWLENRGDLDFAHHRLVDLPGAYRAKAADFDQDGDLDIIIVAWLPSNIRLDRSDRKLASIVYLEQSEDATFRKFTLEWGHPNFATLALGDFDNDGRIDFAVAGGPTLESSEKPQPFTIWWNRTSTESEMTTSRVE